MEQYIENMDDEIRCDYLVTTQMKQLWNVQLNLAVKLIEVCAKHDLKIVADSGTALGAVRHQGFIPWDDDMDFRMPRKDYDKLVQIAPDEFKSPYFLQNGVSENGFFIAFSKLRYDNTSMILEIDAFSGAKYHQGINIDIFPDDFLPDTVEATNILIKRKEIVSDYVYFRNYRFFFLLPLKLAGFIKNAFRLRNKAFWSDKRLMKYIDLILADDSGRNFDKMGLISFMHSYRPRCMINSNLYNEIIYLPFEKIKLPIFLNYDELLTTEYGDYHKLVKGYCSHRVTKFDPHRSYKNYLRIVRPSYFKLLVLDVEELYNFIKNKL